MACTSNDVHAFALGYYLWRIHRDYEHALGRWGGTSGITFALPLLRALNLLPSSAGSVVDHAAEWAVREAVSLTVLGIRAGPPQRPGPLRASNAALTAWARARDSVAIAIENDRRADGVDAVHELFDVGRSLGQFLTADSPYRPGWAPGNQDLLAVTRSLSTLEPRYESVVVRAVLGRTNARKVDPPGIANAVVAEFEGCLTGGAMGLPLEYEAIETFADELHLELLMARPPVDVYVDDAGPDRYIAASGSKRRSMRGSMMRLISALSFSQQSSQQLAEKADIEEPREVQRLMATLREWLGEDYVLATRGANGGYRWHDRLRLPAWRADQQTAPLHSAPPPESGASPTSRNETRSPRRLPPPWSLLLHVPADAPSPQ